MRSLQQRSSVLAHVWNVPRDLLPYAFSMVIEIFQGINDDTV